MTKAAIVEQSLNVEGEAVGASEIKAILKHVKTMHWAMRHMDFVIVVVDVPSEFEGRLCHVQTVSWCFSFGGKPQADANAFVPGVFAVEQETGRVFMTAGGDSVGGARMWVQLAVVLDGGALTKRGQA